jgi:two-component sensor histidine kinase
MGEKRFAIFVEMRKALLAITDARYCFFAGERRVDLRMVLLCVGLMTVLLFSSPLLRAQYVPLNVSDLKEQIKNAKSDSAKTRLLSILGWELRFTDHKESEKLADEIIRIVDGTDNYLRLAEAYQIKGFARVLEQKLPETLEQYGIALGYAKKAKSGYVHAHLLSLIAGMYQDKGDFDKAIKYYLEGLQVAEAYHTPEMIATLANNLAEAYSDAGRSINITLPFYEKALKEETTMGNWQYVGMIYSNIAKEQMLAGNKAEAEKAAKLSLENIHKKNDRAYVYGTVASDLGEVYSGLGNYDEAEKLLKEGFKILDSIGTKDNKLIPLSALAKLYIKKNESVKAENAAKQLLQLSTAYKTKLFLRDANQVLYEVAKKSNRPADALQFFEQYKNWNDSVFNENKEKSIANIESRLKLEQKDLEIKYETEKKAKENLALKQSNVGLQNRSVAILIITVILLVLGIVMVASNRTMGRKNAELEKQKRIIQKQSEEKDTLIREINHRVKNNLQIISSLLNLQANSLTDFKAMEALRDSHKRVKAISLIHQKLYGFEDVASIPLEEYINALFADLKMVYAANHVQMHCYTEPDGMRLDMESAVPVGLILNETITNALKYAFADKSTGMILIHFTEDIYDTYTLSIKDDGKGLPEGFDPEKSSSLGFRIIKELTRQLRGKFTYATDKGTIFTISFPNTSARKKMS